MTARPSAADLHSTAGELVAGLLVVAPHVGVAHGAEGETAAMPPGALQWFAENRAYDEPAPLTIVNDPPVLPNSAA